MQFLVFQLQAPLAAWGDVAVGEYRGSREHPGASALIGLLGAALGVRRDDEAGHAALRDGYGFAVGTVATGHLLRDYHTAQVPGRSSLTGRPHRTRRPIPPLIRPLLKQAAVNHDLLPRHIEHIPRSGHLPVRAKEMEFHGNSAGII